MARLLKHVGNRHRETVNASDLLMPLSLSGAGTRWSGGLSALADVLRAEGSDLTTEDTNAAARVNAAARLHPYTRPFSVPNWTGRRVVDPALFQLHKRAVAIPVLAGHRRGRGDH
jgi:hypothetical protein